MRRLSLFRLSRAHDSELIFHDHAYVQNLKDRPVSVCQVKYLDLQLPLTFGDRKLVVLGVWTSIGNVVDVIAAVTIRLY